MSTKECDHCREEIVHEFKLIQSESEKYFCCNGCLSVYQILISTGLEDYYKLHAGEKTTGPAQIIDSTFSYLDEKEFVEKYYRIEDGHYLFKFFIEGVHCVACLWLLEKLARFNVGVISSKLNMATSVIEIKIDLQYSLANIALQISKLGYRPHPILVDSDVEELTKKEDRKSLMQIGVAFACAGNIMLYSLAVYNGAEGFFKDYFHLFTFICAIPVLFYSAVPFYKNAYYSLKTKEPSIDVPIASALITGFGMGIYSLIFNRDFFYFDSLSTLVFLLLFARYILKKTQLRALKSEDLASLFSTRSAKKLINGKELDVLTRFLKIGDQVVIYPDEVVPIDGIIESGKSFLNNSLLTGEVAPVMVNVGKSIYMGAKNLDSKLVVRVAQTSQNTRLGKILAEIEQGWKSESKISLLTDKISKNFVYFVFGLSVLFFIYFSLINSFEVGFSRTLTLLIITCPCALALTTPLALVLGLSAMAKEGIIIKNEQVLEKLAQIKSVYLDKTGTLTNGDFEIILKSSALLEKENQSILYALESRSSHPIGKSFVKYLEKVSVDTNLNITEFIEEPGVGVRGNFNGELFHVKSSEESESSNTQIGFFKENIEIASFELIDKLQAGVEDIINQFSSFNIKPFLLSGDKKGPVF